jgi:hypothetical protein
MNRETASEFCILLNSRIEHDAVKCDRLAIAITNDSNAGVKPSVSPVSA